MSTIEMVQVISSLAATTTTVNPSPLPPLPLNNPTPLILHLDINETILVGDDAGGDTRDESLHKILAKSAFIRLPDSYQGSLQDLSTITPTHWWDGTIIGKDNAPPPPPPLYTGWEWPPGCAPYYRTAYKQRSKHFANNDGRCYRNLYDKMEEIISLEDDTLPDIMSHLLPSLFHTLAILSERQEPFRLVLRSFGSDIEQVAEAISLFAQGKHPDYSDFTNHALVATPNDFVKGRWKILVNDGETTFQLYKDDDSVIASGDEEVLDWIQERTICGIQDDYDYWSKNHCEPWAGKPVWVPSHNKRQHHVLFDDNIHNLEHDSIASVRMQYNQQEPFRTLSGRQIQQMQGVHLVRVPTIEPILNQDWFLQQIDQARARYAAAAAATTSDTQDKS